jgi:hypothetical protein
MWPMGRRVGRILDSLPDNHPYAIIRESLPFFRSQLSKSPSLFGGRRLHADRPGDLDALIEQLVAHGGGGGLEALVLLLRVVSSFHADGDERALMRLAGLAFDACEAIAHGEGAPEVGPGEGPAYREGRLRELAGRAEADQLPLQLALDGLAYLAGAGAESWFLSEYLGLEGGGDGG